MLSKTTRFPMLFTFQPARWCQPLRTRSRAGQEIFCLSTLRFTPIKPLKTLPNSRCRSTRKGSILERLRRSCRRRNGTEEFPTSQICPQTNSVRERTRSTWGLRKEARRLSGESCSKCSELLFSKLSRFFGPSLGGEKHFVYCTWFQHRDGVRPSSGRTYFREGVFKWILRAGDLCSDVLAPGYRSAMARL